MLAFAIPVSWVADESINTGITRRLVPLQIRAWSPKILCGQQTLGRLLLECLRFLFISVFTWDLLDYLTWIAKVTISARWSWLLGRIVSTLIAMWPHTAESLAVPVILSVILVSLSRSVHSEVVRMPLTVIGIIRCTTLLFRRFSIDGFSGKWWSK